jgi:hypothetical protein
MAIEPLNRNWFLSRERRVRGGNLVTRRQDRLRDGGLFTGLDRDIGAGFTPATTFQNLNLAASLSLLFRSACIAVEKLRNRRRHCAGANGFLINMLLRTSWDPHASAAAQVI